MEEPAAYWENIMDALNDGVYISDRVGKTIMASKDARTVDRPGPEGSPGQTGYGPGG